MTLNAAFPPRGASERAQSVPPKSARRVSQASLCPMCRHVSRDMSSASPQDPTAATKTTAHSSTGSAGLSSRFETNGIDAAANWMPGTPRNEQRERVRKGEETSARRCSLTACRRERCRQTSRSCLWLLGTPLALGKGAWARDAPFPGLSVLAGLRRHVVEGTRRRNRVTR